MEKRAQGLSINAVILIILGLAVLIVLALGFTQGWNKILPWISGEKNNVDTIYRACETACGSESLYNYCSVKREIGDGISTYKNVTCYTLGILELFKPFGVKACSNLDCKVKCDGWEYLNPKGERVYLKDDPVANQYCVFA